MVPFEPRIEYYGLDVKYLPKAFGQLDPSWWRNFCVGEV